MPKTATSSTKTAFGKRMLAAREAAGMRLDEAAVFARVELRSSYGPSRETVRRYEVGDVDEDRADMVTVAALARVYKVPMEALSPALALQFQHVMGWATPINTTRKRPAATPPTSRRRKPGPRSNIPWNRAAA